MMALLDKGARRLSRAAAITGGTLILLSALVVFADVLMRRFLGWTLGGADELSGYALAIGTAWALPYCLLWRANIRVDSLYRLAPHRLRALLDVFGLIVLGAFALLLTYRAGLVLMETIDRGSRSVTPLNVPLVIPQSIWLAGLVWYAMTLVLTFVRAVTAMLVGDHETITEIAGSGPSRTDSSQQSVM
jgi:TRAP-type C4-dicarboxylate transport system permease small subunit